MIEMDAAVHCVSIDGESLTLEQFLAVARDMAKVKLHISGKRNCSDPEG